MPVKKKKATKAKAKTKSKKGPRGGLAKMRVTFKGQGKTLEQLFGGAPIQVTDMTKKLWAHVKRNKLMSSIK